MAIAACRDFREISGLKNLPNGTKHCKIIAAFGTLAIFSFAWGDTQTQKVHNLTCRQKLSTENSNQKNGNHCLQRFPVSKTSQMAQNMIIIAAFGTSARFFLVQSDAKPPKIHNLTPRETVSTGKSSRLYKHYQLQRLRISKSFQTGRILVKYFEWKL